MSAASFSVVVVADRRVDSSDSLTGDQPSSARFCGHYVSFLLWLASWALILVPVSNTQVLYDIQFTGINIWGHSETGTLSATPWQYCHADDWLPCAPIDSCSCQPCTLPSSLDTFF